MTAENFSEIYEYLLGLLITDPQYVSSPRNKLIHEHTNISYTLENPLSNQYENKIRSTPQKYLKGELIWYFSGSNLAKDIIKYSKFWDHIKNPDNETVNSAYGYLLFEVKNKHNINSWDWCFESLLKDKESRQALLHFNRPDHAFKQNKDFVCTLNGLFSIRENKLHLTITQRSCDMIRGLTFDTPFFTLLQYFMWNNLKRIYPDLQLGYFTHFINSLHIYEEHFNLVEDMLNNKFHKKLLMKPDISFDDFRAYSKAIVNDVEIKNTKSDFLNWILN